MKIKTESGLKPEDLSNDQSVILPLGFNSSSTPSVFRDLYTIDVSEIAEKNYQGVAYISWACAWAKLKAYDPACDYKIHWFDQKPYLETPRGCFVQVTITVKGESATEILPVMDSTGKATTNPDARDVNDNIKRCMVKAASLLGFGLKIYEGEDIWKNKKPDTPEDLSSYIIPIGKNKGKTLGEIELIDLHSSIEWLKNQRKKEPLSATAAEYVEAADQYIKSLNK